MRFVGYVRQIDPSTNENVFTEAVSVDMDRMVPVMLKGNVLARNMFMNDVYWRVDE